MNDIFENLYEMTAFSNIIAEPQFLIMYAIAFVLLYLGIKKQYELILRFDEEHKQVSYKEKSIDIDTELSTHNVSCKKEVRYGNRKEFSFGGSWEIKTDGTVGEQYAYKFSPSPRYTSS